MSLVIHSAIAALVALGTLGCATRSSTDTAPPGITMARLRAEVDPHICALFSPEVQEWGGPIHDDRCPQPTPGTPLAQAVQAAVLRVRPVGLLLTTGGQYFDTAARGQPGSAQSAVDTIARAAFWRDPQLSRATALALDAELRARGWQCEDCPPVAPPPPLTLPWSTFLPYLSAYIHPQDGDAGKVDIYICSGTNGLAALPPDPRLQQAGAMVAMQFTEIDAITSRIHTIATTSQSASAAATDLRSLLSTPLTRTHACTALEHIEWLTSLSIAECTSSSADKNPA